jgi:hypothetical protein
VTIVKNILTIKNILTELYGAMNKLILWGQMNGSEMIKILEHFCKAFFKETFLASFFGIPQRFAEVLFYF